MYYDILYSTIPSEVKGELVRFILPPVTGKLISISISIRSCVARRSCVGAWEMLPDAGAANGKFSAGSSWSVGVF